MDQIFDFHARLAGRIQDMLSTMDRWGIARAAVSAGGVLDLDQLATQVIEGGGADVDADNEAVAAACQESDGRLVPFYLANPHRDPALLRDQAGRFRGLEISPAVHGVALSDERSVALIEVARDLRLPVYVVCLGRPGFSVIDLLLLADKFPEVTFVLGHCGFVGIDVYAVGKVASRSNIVAETSGCYTRVARIAVARLGCDRVLFGTEYPLQHPSVELAKLAALELDEPAWQQVAWRNAHRLLGEDCT